MGFFSRIYYFFAPYTDSNERAVGLFFAGLTEHSNQSQTRTRLDELLQRDIAVINLWSEFRYKGYKYLRKSQRKKLYANLQLIEDDFETFRQNSTKQSRDVQAHIHSLAPHATIDDERALLFHALTAYFSPKRGVYEYRDSSSFGRLLHDPQQEKLVGDCNQIVTLYIYLYSRYFDIRDLQMRLLPGHIALHYGGVDIETTNGTFANYDNKTGGSLQPVEEIVSVNLLDTTDAYLKTHEVAAEDFLQASRFAFILSHDRSIVTSNLDAAYGKLINSLMDRHNFHAALKFAKASRDITLLGVVGHNGAIYEMQRHNYASARRFASHSPKKADLIHDSYHAEGVYHFNAHRYHDAITAFEKSGDTSSVRSCYEGLFFSEQNKLGNNLTSDTIKKHASTIKRMRGYAKKSGNRSLLDHASGLAKYL